MFHASAKMQMHGTYGIFCHEGRHQSSRGQETVLTRAGISPHEGRRLSSQECIFIVYVCNTVPPSPMSDPAYLQNAFGVMVLRMPYPTLLRRYS